MQRRQFCKWTVALSAATSGATVTAQTSRWPQRNVRWILSQPAGSGPDILARFIAEGLSRTWGQPVVIENRPGGQNVIGAQAAARSAPDGYTFYYATTAAMVTNLYTFKNLPYDPQKDFTPVRLVGRSPFVIASGASSNARDLAEVIAQAKAQPGRLAIATEGPKTFSGMLADAWAFNAGIKLNHVPYTKAPDAIQDVIGGRVALICLPEAALISYVRSGQMRALAVSSARRLPTLPNVPALAESIEGFEFTGWNGLFAPAGTPDDIIARVHRDLEALLRQPEVAQKLESLGSVIEPSMSVAGFDTFMKSEYERWARIVKSIGVVPE